MLSTRWEEKGLGWTLSFIHCHLPDRIEDGDKLGSCDCKFEENISSECNLNFFLIKRENIQVTVKSRVKLNETAKLTIDLALLWIQNCSKAACKVSLDQNPANHNSQS